MKSFHWKRPFLWFLNAFNFHNYKRYSLNRIKEMIEWLSQNFLARELCSLSTYWSEVCRSGKYVNCESRFFDVTLWPQFQNLEENTIWNMIAPARICKDLSWLSFLCVLLNDFVSWPIGKILAKLQANETINPQYELDTAKTWGRYFFLPKFRPHQTYDKIKQHKD